MCNFKVLHIDTQCVYQCVKFAMCIAVVLGSEIRISIEKVNGFQVGEQIKRLARRRDQREWGLGCVNIGVSQPSCQLSQAI